MDMSQKQEQTVEQEEQQEWQQQLDEVMSGEAPKKKKKKFSKKKKKWIIIGIAAVAVVFLIVSFGGNSGPIGPMVTTQSLEKQNIASSLSIQGPISGTNSVHVVSRLNAEILEIHVKEGDKVEKDQILAVIDDKDVQREVELAQNAYDLAVANKQEQQLAAESGYERARQNLQAARRKVDRMNALNATGGVSQVELEEAQTELANASAEINTYTLVNGNPSAPASYDLQIQQAQMSLDKVREDVENTQLKSPIAGTVVRVNSKVGQFADTVEDDNPIFIIENLDELEMKINISEYSIGKVSVGQSVSIRADILDGETVAGEVVSISPTGEEKGGGSTERVIPVTIKILEENSKLIAGITARADIVLEEENDTLAVPLSALIQQEDGDYIAAVENQLVRLIAVTTGVESDISVAIRPVNEGELTEGMAVVVSPFPGMTEGMTVLTEGGQ